MAVERAMGMSSRMRVGGVSFFLLGLLLWAGSGCSFTPAISTGQILRQQGLLDFTGLLPQQQIENLKVWWAVPRDWEPLPPKRGPMFIHQQYRSPTGVTGVGVAYVRLPLPVPTGVVAWLAQREYLRRYNDNKEGQVLARWTDDAGREWFEAENNRYHGVGYIMCKGQEAWIVYSGYRVTRPANAEEIAVSRRSARTIIPILND
jgi:hypothetical protein